MNKYLKILQDKKQNYYRDIQISKQYADYMLEFFTLPFDKECQNMVTKSERKKLKTIVKKIKYIKQNLAKISTEYLINQNSKD